MRPGRRDEEAGGDDRGAAMVEFALVLPVLVTLLVAIIQFGSAYNTKLALQAAAREGARAAALGDDGVSATQNAASPHDLDAADIDVTECPESGEPLDDADAEVVARKDFTFSIPFVDLGTVELSARGVMRCGV
jgi:Flp pilus assembly protein TadG